MKLRTRMILISCITLLFSIILGDIIIWRIVRENQLNSAAIRAYQNAINVSSDFEKSMTQGYEKGITQSKIFATYYLRQLRDDYVICFSVTYADDEMLIWEELYNHTNLSYEELLEITATSYDLPADIPSDRFNTVMAEFRRDGRHYYVFRSPSFLGLQLYHITDVTEVYRSLAALALIMALVTLGITGTAMLTLWIALRRMMQPLHELNESARRMAEGRYDHRVKVVRPDEIGELGENFNKMAEAVESRTRHLVESEQKKTLFMGNLTHELKTPMTAISGYAQTLLHVKLSPEDTQEALTYIYQECGRLERLSRKMLRLLELDTEEELEFFDTPASSLFDSVQKACRVILQCREITLECLEQGETFWVEPDLMTDALVNLVDNAAKASPTGSRILLRAGEGFLEVQDFGKGIPIEEQEKILEPFYMVDKSRSRKGGGAGLGLALTALIAKRHHITLSIDSEEGNGTRIRLQFV